MNKDSVYFIVSDNLYRKVNSGKYPEKVKCNYQNTKGWLMSLQAQNEKYPKIKERVAKSNDDHLLMFLKVMSVIFLIVLLYH